MDEVGLVMIGILVGFIVCSKIGVSIAVVMMERGQVQAAGKPLWPVFTAMTLHSGPWLLVVVVVSTVLFLRASDPPAWGWSLFIGGAGAIFYVVFLAVALLRIRAKRLRGTSSV
jgi:hypothetical protein